MADDLFIAFVRESNKIEGILRDPTAAEIEATEAFQQLEKPTIADVAALVKVYQPDAVLRDRIGLNVRVGSHIAPPGGPAIVHALGLLLHDATLTSNLYDIHCRYETLHPFTDGNGRSGRALWLWHLWNEYGIKAPQLGFLHLWYYESLKYSRQPHQTGGGQK